MTTLARLLAWFNALSTLLGLILLWFFPATVSPALAGTAFEGRTILAGALLGVVVGGFQWAAIGVDKRAPQRRWTAHLLAGCVMMGWIFGEALVLNAFAFLHLLYAVTGAAQVVATAVALGALKERRAGEPRSGSPAPQAATE